MDCIANIKSENIVQNLQNNNWTTLNKLFQTTSQPELISSTVSQLPDSAIVPFVVYLKENSPYRLDDFPNHSTWLLQVLRHHYKLLKAIPAEERQVLLKPLLRFNKENAAAFPKVYQWKARLDHFYRKDKQFTEAAVGDAGAPDSSETPNKPVLLFNKNEDSSDDEDLGGASTVGASESEENWDELSEVAHGSSDDDSDPRLSLHDGNVSMLSSSRGDCDIIDVEDESGSDMEDEDEVASDHDKNTSDHSRSGGSEDDTSSSDEAEEEDNPTDSE